MEGKLFDELKDINNKCRRFMPPQQSDVKEMSQQLLKVRPELITVLGDSLEFVARSYLLHVSTIPLMICLLESILEKTPSSDERRRTSVLYSDEWRHAAVLSFVYLVRTDDLIPDNAPVGFGFIDDCVVLRIACANLLGIPDLLGWYFTKFGYGKYQYQSGQNFLEDWLASGDYVSFLALSLPPAKRSDVDKLVGEVSSCFPLCRAWAAVDPTSLEHRTKQLIENPRLPGPVLTHPEQDPAVWSRWETADVQRKLAKTEKRWEERNARRAEDVGVEPRLGDDYKEGLRKEISVYPLGPGGSASFNKDTNTLVYNPRYRNP